MKYNCRKPLPAVVSTTAAPGGIEEIKRQTQRKVHGVGWRVLEGSEWDGRSAPPEAALVDRIEGAAAKWILAD